jgi:hypothetical protein
LLELTANVVRAAVRAGDAPSPAAVSMAVFNAAKVGVDRARGIPDPERTLDRTPTAQAIQLRFKQLAGRPIPWPELLSGALRPARQRVMWLAALRREDRRDDLSDELVTHALWLVATHKGAETLSTREYVQRREKLVAQDRELQRRGGPA